MTQPSVPASTSAHHHWFEFATTVLLAAAAVATAWASYQAARWHGKQAEAQSASIAARVESTRASNVADREAEIDVEIFIQWVDAFARGQTELADFYRRRFRDEFKPPFAAWIATKPLQTRIAVLGMGYVLFAGAAIWIATFPVTIAV